MPRLESTKCLPGARLWAMPDTTPISAASGTSTRRFCSAASRKWARSRLECLCPLRKEAPAYDRPRPGDDWQPWDESLKGHWLHTELWANQTPDTIEHADSSLQRLLHRSSAQSSGQRDAPFFMYLGFNSPHDPRQSPKEYLDRYPQDKIEVPPNFLPEHPFDQGDYKSS